MWANIGLAALIFCGGNRSLTALRSWLPPRWGKGGLRHGADVVSRQEAYRWVRRLIKRTSDAAAALDRLPDLQQPQPVEPDACPRRRADAFTPRVPRDIP